MAEVGRITPSRLIKVQAAASATIMPLSEALVILLNFEQIAKQMADPQAPSGHFASSRMREASKIASLHYSDNTTLSRLSI